MKLIAYFTMSLDTVCRCTGREPARLLHSESYTFPSPVRAGELLRDVTKETRHLSLHEMRWPFAAARSVVYIAILAILAQSDPAGTSNLSPVARSVGETFQLYARDVIVSPREHEWTSVGSNWYANKELGDRLRWYKENNPQSRFVLRVKPGTSVGQFRAVINAGQAAGIHSFTIEVSKFTPLARRRLATIGFNYFDRTELHEPKSEFILVAYWQ